MAVPSGYDIGLDSTDPADANPVRGFMLTAHRQQDITPSSARRSDGDTRFQLIPSESYWSQTDWTAGFNRVTPADPALYWQGPADTRSPGQLQAALAWTTNAGAYVSQFTLAMCPGLAGEIYVVTTDGASGFLWKHVAGTITNLATLASASVTGIVLYRGAVWIAYGNANSVQKYDLVGGTGLTTPSPNFKAQVLCAYSSMLFYAKYDSTTQTIRLNRYDPENTAAVSDLAILPTQIASWNYVGALVALGPDLFVVCADALWKFTSQNGNSGVLVGPVDSWVPTNSATGASGEYLSGLVACAFQGAVIYSSGEALRRHQPGGGAKQIWPILPTARWSWVPGSLSPVDDKLYITAAPTGVGVTSTATHTIGLFCWNGAGMHHLGTETVTFAAATPLSRTFGACDSKGYLTGSLQKVSTPSAGSKTGYWALAPSVAPVRAATTVFRSSILDFGTADLDKVISRIGVDASVPAGCAIAVTLNVLDTSGTPAWLARVMTVTTGTFPTAADTYGLVYYSRAAPTFVVGKQFYLEVTLTTAGSTATPVIRAITAIPNPVYPVRYGFRIDIPLGTHVRTHTGELAYADQAAVDAALAYLRAMRAASYPFALDWIDGASYYVRTNTLTIARDLLRPDESAWVATLDLQQISG